ncbi:hypothetical protein TVAG_494950 [Trichomonas vaginalis G3]|uniref:Uncharacterized protein n=1 Tax=Trichomonas vaginalis (strain ATCC PRA-98 / G3) TaxID=412133 RepID=A2EXU2_TRIV3|nr:RelA-associated inhibitor family [Trichomonas vaginalis G3]EAY02546.1 hypothetical protein TVAG_494950 [Trichomonas vaginalis G3]KAI5506038.1 RelA-associated inhibitor family [Trichomonas vaginalis G3]|eukprot:XP_001314785.1 hypothetical protein [Trichomonas vaginalis G3]
MSTIDYSYYAKHIKTYCNDEEFVELRTVDEMCQIMQRTKLPVSQFVDLFLMMKKHFNPIELFQILQSTKLNIGSNLKDIQKVIICLSCVLDAKIFSKLSDSIDLYSKNSASEPKLMNVLKKCPMTDSLDNLNSIYKILSLAAEKGQENVIKYAINTGYADVNGDIILRNIESTYELFQSNVLIKAASEGDLNLVKALERNGAAMGYRTEYGECILHAFCLSGNLEGVKYALNFFDVNDVSVASKTPFFCAVWASQLHVIDFLIKRRDLDKGIKAVSGSVLDSVISQIRGYIKLAEKIGKKGMKTPVYRKYVFNWDSGIDPFSSLRKKHVFNWDSGIDPFSSFKKKY